MCSRLTPFLSQLHCHWNSALCHLHFNTLAVWPCFLLQKPLFVQRKAGKYSLHYFSIGLKYMWRTPWGPTGWVFSPNRGEECLLSLWKIKALCSLTTRGKLLRVCVDLGRHKLDSTVLVIRDLLHHLLYLLNVRTTVWFLGHQAWQQEALPTELTWILFPKCHCSEPQSHLRSSSVLSGSSLQWLYYWSYSSIPSLPWDEPGV